MTPLAMTTRRKQGIVIECEWATNSEYDIFDYFRVILHHDFLLRIAVARHDRADEMERFLSDELPDFLMLRT
jgi:hypothetical protein